MSESRDLAAGSFAEEADEIDRAPGLASVSEPIGAERYTVSGRISKRLLDIMVSLALLVILSPVLIVIGLVVRRTSSGPALFRQTRVGYEERLFTIWKFRTMANNTDPSEHRRFVQAMLNGEVPAPSEDDDVERGTVKFKLVDDPRVTGVGAWLRHRSLDELPQLVNVLRGDMSLVGPRPTLEYEVSEYIPEHRQRAKSMPGMTGLWQVGGRSDLHMTEALDLDVVYVQTCSFWSDMVILAKTATVVIKGTGV